MSTSSTSSATNKKLKLEVILIIILAVILIGFLIFSLLIKFMASLFEPVVDAKYYKLIIGVTDVFNSLVALLFVCGFIFILTVLFTITATSNIF